MEWWETSPVVNQQPQGEQWWSASPVVSGQPPAAAAKPAAISPPIDWTTRLKSLLGDPEASATVNAANTAALRNSPMGGFVRGLRDPLDAAAQLLARGVAAAAPTSPFAQQQLADTEATNRAAETDYSQNWRQGAAPGFDTGRLAGGMAAMAPLAYAMPGTLAPSLAGRVGAGALTGAASGALQPVEPGAGDFWRQKALQTGVGGALGAAVPAVLGGVAGVVRPNTSPEVQQLMDAGVRPTPGQIMGGSLNRAEQGLTSLPGPGDFIAKGRYGAVADFNRAAINKALAPIGEKLETSSLGRDAISEMQTKVTAAYDKVASGLGIATTDPATGAPSIASRFLANGIGQIDSAAAYMPPERATQLRGILQKEVLDKLSPGGGMTGQSFQDAKSKLGELATDYLNSTSADERQLGGALLQAQVVLRNALRIANPQAASGLDAADGAFAQMLRIQKAATSTGQSEPGVFSPAQLQAAVKSLDPSLRKRAFAAGDALMQDFAESGRKVLGNTVPDSGTPYRWLVGPGGAGMAGSIFGYGPEALAALLTGTGATAAAYSPAGRAVLNKLLAARPSGAAPVAEAIRRVAPLGSAGVPRAYGALAGP